MAAAVEQGSHRASTQGRQHPQDECRGLHFHRGRESGWLLRPGFRRLTEAEREGRRQSFIYEEFLRDCVPGFSESNIIGLSSSIGVRESRRVHGRYRLTREDCLGKATFDDKVLICGAPIEDHRASNDGQEETHWAYVPDGGVYEVPYRTLVPQGAEQVLVCGRCFSATHDAHASCRSMARYHGDGPCRRNGGGTCSA